MAFFFSAVSTQKYIYRLERRIESLEKQAGPRMDAVSRPYIPER
jgi:hypothetical protein